MMKLARRFLVLAALLGAVSACRRARAPGAGVQRTSAADSAEAHAAPLRYLAAFDSLQLDAVRATLALDVTTFMPGGRLPWTRLDGRPAVEAEHRRMFDAVRARAAQRGWPARRPSASAPMCATCG